MSRGARSRLPRALSLPAAFAAILALGVSSWALEGGDGMRVEVEGAQQLVTLDGSHPSLRAVLEELAWRAGFELRRFGIEDRAVSARVERVPMRDALRRLMARDPYMIGVSVGTNGVTQTRWVEVPGPLAAARPPVSGDSSRGAASGPTPAASTASAAEFRIPPGVFLAAFEGESESAREEALRAIETQLDDRAQRDAFLRTDAATLADAVAPHRHAVPSLRTLATRQRDPVVRRRLEELMGLLYESVERAPGAYAPSPSPLAEYFE